ncbi:MAG: spore protease YyaC [Syntrophomonas sp.]
MLIVEKHYTDPEAHEALVAGLNRVLASRSDKPLFLCIGSERHLLDSFGPLTGTLLEEKAPHILVCGTLDNPLHARNLSREMLLIKSQCPGKIQIAIDASAGEEKELGMIKIKEGSLLPGKAFAKRLPPIGDYSIIGMLGTRVDRRTLKSSTTGSMKHVYQMARLVSEVIIDWSMRRNRI